MGARPIACLDSLRFGGLNKPRQRYLFDGAVAGISAYGNCLGVPTVGGEIYFDTAYEGNCLIDVMGVGLMREENLTRAVGSGPGNHVVLIGSSTGRDGIGGASVLASQEFDEAAENKRPAVQVGDPLQEKLLIEVCLDLLNRGLFVALGDLGAAGLTSSASEMASRGGVGIDIDVSKVHRRENGMQAFEVMVSESQERMLAVVTPENLPEIKRTCAKWEIACSVIGSITDTGRFVVRDGDLDGAVVADMPAEKLAEDAPEYDPAMTRPAYLDEVQSFDPNSLDLPESGDELKRAFADLLASPNISSRSWIWQQYDHQVQDNTAILPGSDAAVLRVSDTGRGLTSQKGIAISTDCNGLYCYLDPKGGATIALVEAARNVSCTGALPLAVTDCLNFGNPEKPEVFYTFSECIDGLVEACEAFEIPVISGNVSFYNESFGNAIYPTPTIGLVGLIEDIQCKMSSSFKAAGDTIMLLGETHDELGGSELLRWCFDKVSGNPPKVDLNHEVRLCSAVRELILGGLIKSAHDCSEGGIALCLAESAIQGSVGFDVDVDGVGSGLGEMSTAAALFSESQGRIVVSADGENVESVIELCEKYKIPVRVIGKVTSEKLVFQNMFDFDLKDATDIWTNTLERMVNGNFHRNG
jgi:phosphoribosylformylglycinamidine synthase